MSGFRRRHPDRDGAVEVIEAAHARGQIGAADRDLRVAEARTAASPGELEALTRDLRTPAAGAATAPTHQGTAHIGPAHPSPAQPNPAQPNPAQPGPPHPGPGGPVGGGYRARPAGPSRSWGLAVVWVIGVVLVGALAVGAAAVAFLVAPSGDVSGSVTVPESAPSPGSPGKGAATASPAPDAFRLAPAEVRTFLRRYESKFGTSEAFDAVLHPTRVSLAVPVRGSRPRAEQWTYDGTWRRDAAASAVVRPGGIVDLGAIGVGQLFGNLVTAERTLGVPRGRVTHVAVRHDVSGTPVIGIYVGNRFGENAHLLTTMSGDRILRSFPLAP